MANLRTPVVVLLLSFSPYLMLLLYKSKPVYMQCCESEGRYGKLSFATDRQGFVDSNETSRTSWDHNIFYIYTTDIAVTLMFTSFPLKIKVNNKYCSRKHDLRCADASHRVSVFMLLPQRCGQWPPYPPLRLASERKTRQSSCCCHCLAVTAYAFQLCSHKTSEWTSLSLHVQKAPHH